jgi:8-oxo-dGTP pyrophosphatase MutT (NUDIX family)
MARGLNSTKIQKAYFREWVKNSETVHQNKWFKLVQNNNFYSIDYHAVQVVVLPVVEEEYILLSKVKRPIVGCSLWECPAGGVEESETNEIAALRELKEETGVEINDSSRLNPLQSLIVSQNRLPMFPAIFSIQLSEEEYQLRKSHDKEVEESKMFSFAEIIEMIKSGDISTAITLSILGRFFLEQGKIIL